MTSSRAWTTSLTGACSAATVTTAFLIFCGRSKLLEAVFGGTVKTLGRFSAAWRADIGTMRSAGSMVSEAVKKVAVKVTLIAAV